MKTITINIIKKSVMGLVEGISATIAKHNPEVDFQTIWASDSEEPVLDIHYREAITDLENFLARFTSETSGLFDLQAQADDFSISIRTMSNWPPRLSGVLSNLVQNYLAHAMVAGWLSDFPDIKTTDYAGMGVKDLDDIKELLLKKDFCFREVARHEDEDSKEIAEARGVEARGADAEAKVEVASGVETRVADGESKVEASASVEARGADGESKKEVTASVETRGADAEAKVKVVSSAEARVADGEAKAEAASGVEARGSDGEAKVEVASGVEARVADGEAKVEIVSFTEARGADVEAKAEGGVRASERNRDFMSQHFHEDCVDWGGGVATLDFV